jgi:hypothetical protein
MFKRRKNKALSTSERQRDRRKLTYNPLDRIGAGPSAHLGAADDEVTVLEKELRVRAYGDDVDAGRPVRFISGDMKFPQHYDAVRERIADDLKA